MVAEHIHDHDHDHLAHTGSNTMNDYDEIEKAIGNVSISGNDDTSDYDGVDELTGTNMVAIMQHRIDTLMNENIEMNNRLKSVEAKTQAMYAHFVKSPERSKFDFPDENRVRDRYVTETSTLDMRPGAPKDSDSYVDIDAGRSVSSISSPSQVRVDRRHDPRVEASGASPRASPRTSTPTRNANPFATYFESTQRSETMFKSNSATAPQGYIHKGSVWGTALVSFLTAATRYYMTKKNANMLMVDEMKMVAVYNKLVPVLYESFMTKELPGVSDPLTFRLSQAIPKKNKSDIPISEAQSWVDLEKTQEGRDIMTIIRILLTAAKAVPEAMVHPISQLIPYIHKQPVMNYNSQAIFLIESGANINPVPTPWESWCLMLKTDALVKYVRYRLNSMTPIETINRMTSEMKPGELADKKNWRKLTTFNPAMMSSRTSSPS